MPCEGVPDPTITGANDVIVRIGGAGVCRTDLLIIEGVRRPHGDPNADRLPPLIMGQENTGWVEPAGNVEVGDPVIVHPKISGGACLACRRGMEMHAPGKRPGLDCNDGDAGFLCLSDRNIVALPRTLAPEDVAPHAVTGFDRRAYRRRNIIERMFGGLENRRRIAARHDRLAAVALVPVFLRPARPPGSAPSVSGVGRWRSRLFCALIAMKLGGRLRGRIAVVGRSS